MEVIRGQPMQTFQQIDERRAAAGLTRKQLYEHAGLHKETWRRTASGKTEPNMRTLRKLASAIDALAPQGEKGHG